MFKMKYNGQEIGLDKDCRIDWDSIKTSTISTVGWCAYHEEMDEIKKKIMIEFEHRNTGNPDYIKIVGVWMDKEYTLQEFVEEVLKMYPSDQGKFNVGYNVVCEYKKGKAYWNNVAEEFLNRIVDGVGGMSSYGHTDYNIVLKSDEPDKTTNSDDGSLMGVIKEMRSELADLRLKYGKRLGMPIVSVTSDESGELHISSDCINNKRVLEIKL